MGGRPVLLNPYCFSPALKGTSASRHYRSVRAFLPFLFLCAAAAWSEEPTDRAPVESVIASLSQLGGHAQPLFTADADAADVERLTSLHRRLFAASSPPWSEVGPPIWSTRSVRFLTPGLALVDGAVTQVDSLIQRHIPVIFVMKRGPAGWRIAAFRVMSEFPSLLGLP